LKDSIMSAAAATKSVDALGTGRRKTSVARVRIRAGSGKITINDRELKAFFTIDQDSNTVVAPLEHCGVRDNVDVQILVHGGGNTGQAGACKASPAPCFGTTATSPKSSARRASSPATPA
jgi:ribosomal protein S9